MSNLAAVVEESEFMRGRLFERQEQSDARYAEMDAFTERTGGRSVDELLEEIDVLERKLAKATSAHPVRLPIRLNVSKHGSEPIVDSLAWVLPSQVEQVCGATFDGERYTLVKVRTSGSERKDMHWVTLDPTEVAQRLGWED